MRPNWLCFIPRSECSNINETKLVMPCFQKWI